MKTVVLLCSVVSLSIFLMSYRSSTQPNDTNVIGKPFPEIKSTSLAGNEVTLPADTKGKIALITVAFVEEGQPAVDSWAEPFLEAYAADDDFVYYEVPMISNVREEAKQYIDSGMRAGIEEKMHPNVVTFYGDYRPYMIALEMDDLRSGYAYLVDRDGIIQFMGSGMMAPEGWEQLTATIEKLSR